MKGQIRHTLNPPVNKLKTEDNFETPPVHKEIANLKDVAEIDNRLVINVPNSVSSVTIIKGDKNTPIEVW